MKTSIIVTCFNNTRTQTHMSMLCLDHIRKFTDFPYQLIVMDPDPKFPIRDDYKTLQLDKEHDALWLRPKPDPGYTKCMNMGAKEATGDVLVFMQNDVFVHENWLEGMLWYIRKGWEAVFPDQVPRDREYIRATYGRHYDDPESLKGGRDAGLLMITAEAFKRTGGWNEDLGLLCEKDFYDRMNTAHVFWTDTNKVLITHIMAATNLHQLDTDPDAYNKRMDHDAKLMQ